MLISAKKQLHKAILQHKVREIIRTPPQFCSKSGDFSLLTMLCETDVQCFLLAAKSFMRFSPPRRAYILNDGTLTRQSKELLKRHIQGTEILEASSFSDDKCPHGGAWERLLAISFLSKNEYIIQMDSDTIFLKKPNEVLNCVITNRAFTLGNWENQNIESMQHRQHITIEKYYTENCHIQTTAEAIFDKLHNFHNLKYAKGCAGFAGFPAGSVNIDFIRGISQEMTNLLGTRWNEWGSEQVMSNIVVANHHSSYILPFQHYTDCNNLKKYSDPHFIHFIGTCRHTSNKYASHACKVIKELQIAAK